MAIKIPRKDLGEALKNHFNYETDYDEARKKAYAYLTGPQWFIDRGLKVPRRFTDPDMTVYPYPYSSVSA